MRVYDESSGTFIQDVTVENFSVNDIEYPTTMNAKITEGKTSLQIITTDGKLIE